MGNDEVRRTQLMCCLQDWAGAGWTSWYFDEVHLGNGRGEDEDEIMKHVLQKMLEEGWGSGLPGIVIIRA